MHKTLPRALLDCLARLTQEELKTLAEFLGNSKFGTVQSEGAVSRLKRENHEFKGLYLHAC
jgi:hypothetical protein